MAGGWTMLDLFSGAGGMSYGFFARPEFRVVGAVDAERGKPGTAASLGCNRTYEANIGVRPLALDLMTTPAEDVIAALGVRRPDGVTVLASCAPCTGFSRTLSRNHLRDDARNSLVGRSAAFVRLLRPAVFLMENARELLRGNFTHHYAALERELRRLGYEAHASVHMLSRFGLPQRRERALVIAVRRGLALRTMEDLWRDKAVAAEATHVRRAIAGLPAIGPRQPAGDDAMHVSPALRAATLRRLRLVPSDGGSWADLRDHPERDEVLTGAMRRNVARGDFGSHPDVYGRMAWDRPAPTIKRECGHVGNGRYAHPEQDRLCSVREMAILQGFPRGYVFAARALANRYRHIGDAVPPVVSYQLAAVCRWVLTGERPGVEGLVLPGTPLTAADVREGG